MTEQDSTNKIPQDQREFTAPPTGEVKSKLEDASSILNNIVSAEFLAKCTISWSGISGSNTKETFENLLESIDYYIKLGNRDEQAEAGHLLNFLRQADQVDFDALGIQDGSSLTTEIQKIWEPGGRIANIIWKQKTESGPATSTSQKVETAVDTKEVEPQFTVPARVSEMGKLTTWPRNEYGNFGEKDEYSSGVYAVVFSDKFKERESLNGKTFVATDYISPDAIKYEPKGFVIICHKMTGNPVVRDRHGGTRAFDRLRTIAFTPEEISQAGGKEALIQQLDQMGIWEDSSGLWSTANDEKNPEDIVRATPSVDEIVLQKNFQEEK